MIDAIAPLRDRTQLHRRARCVNKWPTLDKATLIGLGREEAAHKAASRQPVVTKALDHHHHHYSRSGDSSEKRDWSGAINLWLRLLLLLPSNR